MPQSSASPASPESPENAKKLKTWKQHIIPVSYVLSLAFVFNYSVLSCRGAWLRPLYSSVPYTLICYLISIWVCDWVQKYCVLDLPIRYGPGCRGQLMEVMLILMYTENFVSAALFSIVVLLELLFIHPQSTEEKMAACGLLLLLLLFDCLTFSTFLLSFETKHPQHCWAQPRYTPMRFSQSLLPHYVAFTTASHLNDSIRKSLWSLSLSRRLSRGHNTLLLRAGDIEKNPGPNAAGKKNRLTVVHVNTRSLLHHFDDVASLVSAHHPRI